jgi:hypothetical protein
LDSPAADFKKILISCLGLDGCGTAAVRVTCLVALAYANGAIDDRADKGNLMYQSELISFKYTTLVLRVPEYIVVLVTVPALAFGLGF